MTKVGWVGREFNNDSVLCTNFLVRYACVHTHISSPITQDFEIYSVYIGGGGDLVWFFYASTRFYQHAARADDPRVYVVVFEATFESGGGLNSFWHQVNCPYGFADFRQQFSHLG